jgi:hypothetical protein
VDWNELYEIDHYKNQEKIYKLIRPTLLSNTLVVPTQKIREHIRDLASNDYYGLKQQVDAFHRTTKKPTTECQSSLISVDEIHHLQTYTIEVSR